MRPLDEELLGLLSRMPFLDRIEAAVFSGWSKGAVYGAVSRMEDEGLVFALTHATPLIAATRRFYLTSAGLTYLGQQEGVAPADLLRTLPVSAWWRRILLERLDALAVIYRLASSVAQVTHPVGFKWFRAMPMDAGLILPGGSTVAVVRQGPTSDRTGFSKRLWRLREGPRPDGILLVAPDDTRLRHSRRLLTGTPAVLALESDAAVAGVDDLVWKLPSVNASIDLRTALDRMDSGGALPFERTLSRISPPKVLAPGFRGEDLPDFMLPTLLKPSEKRAVDLVSDWPWIALDDLAGLLNLSRTRTYRLASALEAFGLVTRVPAGGRRLTLTDRGLALLARRDRTSVGRARKRWSAAPKEADNWRSVSGRRSRQLLRNMEHTEAVHGFLATLARQARVHGWETSQLDPPRRASRYFRHFGGVRSVQPDAFGILIRKDVVRPFFLEWERRAVRPGTMSDRLAPYLRYYSTQRPVDDHGAMPAVLVVFHEELAATHFLRVAAGEMDRVRVFLPLMVSHMALLEGEGPLGRTWLAPGGSETMRLVPVS